MPILNRPLRVLHIISGDLWAGAEAQAFTLLSQLAADTELFVILLNDGELADRLKRKNTNLLLIPETFHNSASIIWRLTRAIGRFDPDIIHTHRQKENIFGCLANYLAILCRWRLSVCLRTAHGAAEFKPRMRQKIQIFLDTWIARHCQAAVIAVSEDLARQLRPKFGGKKVVVIRNGVNKQELLAKATEADFKANQLQAKHIGIIGRLEPVKRVDIFLEIAQIMTTQSNLAFPLKFHVIGDGKLRKSLEQRARHLGLGEVVIFHGQRADIPSCIKSLDCIVMCSDHEGTPMVALEAISLGTPMVVHAVGGLNEIFDGVNESLVVEQTAKAYISKIEPILTLGRAGVVDDSRYSAETNARQTLKLYQTLIQKGAAT